MNKFALEALECRQLLGIAEDENTWANTGARFLASKFFFQIAPQKSSSGLEFLVQSTLAYLSFFTIDAGVNLVANDTQNHPSIISYFLSYSGVMGAFGFPIFAVTEIMKGHPSNALIPYTLAWYAYHMGWLGPEETALATIALSI